MKIVKTHWIRRYKCGYELRCEDIEHAGDTCKITSAYTPQGCYIGTANAASFLVNIRGIMPELRSPTSNTCTIGYSHIDGKWYGWSHRAIHGFKVGDKVKYGDCGYVPEDADGFIHDLLESLKSLKDLKVDKKAPKVQISWIGDAGVRVVKEWDYPTTYGKGEWVAKTTADARQMAIDFARGVS